MIRNDFVSNSSSSSFIVSSEDNKFDILLQDYDSLTLEEYIKHYIREDLFGYGIDFKFENMKFVSDSQYNKQFGRGITYTFPLSARDSVEAYMTLSKNRPDGRWDSDAVRKWNENLDSIFNIIKEKILETLQIKWSDVKFHCAEVDDNFLGDDENYCRDDLVNTNEELVEERIEYMDKLKPLKFYRTFSHH